MLAIKNMEMPKSCVDCKLCLLGYCCVTDRRIFESTRRNDCPLVEIDEVKDGKTNI